MAHSMQPIALGVRSAHACGSEGLNRGQVTAPGRFETEQAITRVGLASANLREVEPGDPKWPTPTSAAASTVMRANHGRDTKPEMAVRSLLHRRGMRFRTSQTIRLEGRRWTRPDVVFPRARVAVYVDGCFWHACPEHGTAPRANAGYWSSKLACNVARDSDTTRRLTD